ncbi:hypothetical protein K503DRAFT_155581 [Rhizopogon vinicolor AM-OR11-026]|uniref:Uncharacterized protein n=1 Tax=Rhizopogon vinicolor AM-OR11-026 TaxID=1314800 RepID=A0A1B7NFA5_9AGAM|nr:hypothetical protein K503DRAFT_155581 [Rhizopogon vinicolor AM-OR11-026]
MIFNIGRQCRIVEPLVIGVHFISVYVPLRPSILPLSIYGRWSHAIFVPCALLIRLLVDCTVETSSYRY